jgi:hypothetical protein
MMKAASFGQRARIMSATCSSAGGGVVRLLERLAQRGGDHGVLALRHVAIHSLVDVLAQLADRDLEMPVMPIA